MTLEFLDTWKRSSPISKRFFDSRGLELQTGGAQVERLEDHRASSMSHTSSCRVVCTTKSPTRTLPILRQLRHTRTLPSRGNTSSRGDAWRLAEVTCAAGERKERIKSSCRRFFLPFSRSYVLLDLRSGASSASKSAGQSTLSSSDSLSNYTHPGRPNPLPYTTFSSKGLVTKRLARKTPNWYPLPPLPSLFSAPRVHPWLHNSIDVQLHSLPSLLRRRQRMIVSASTCSSGSCA